MSSWPTDEDLIDFEVGSPDLPQGSLTTLLDSESLPRSLLDSELLHLEETLQTASSSPQKPLSRCTSQDSVELEQILITIDDDLAKKEENSGSRCEEEDKCHDIERRLSSDNEDINFIVNRTDNLEHRTDDLQTNLNSRTDTNIKNLVKEETHFPVQLEENCRNKDVDLQSICTNEETTFYNSVDSDEKYLPILNRTENLSPSRRTSIDLQSLSTISTNTEISYLPLVDSNQDQSLYLPRTDESLDISSALEELDKVLKQSTNSNNKFEDNDETDGLVTEENEDNIEDCLKDLDEYLQGFDTSGSDLEEERVKHLGRSKSLRYSKGKENLGFEHEERRPVSADLSRNNIYRNTIESKHSHKRPLSADVDNQRRKKMSTDETNDNFKRSSFRQSLDIRRNKVRPYSADCQTFKRNKLRNTISKIPASKSSQNINQINNDYFKTIPINILCQNILQDQTSTSRSLPRTNVAVDDVQISLQSQQNRSRSFPRNYRGLQSPNKQNRSISSESDEEIDWSWVQDMSPPTTTSLPQSPPTPKLLTPHWLRSSMRRLRHLPLPASQPAVSSTPSLADPVVLNSEPRARPVSAPVRVERTDRSLDRESTGSAGSESTESTTSEESERPEERREDRRPCDPPPQTMPDLRSPLGQWPHGLSSMLACLGCTIGLFNISRFAVMSVRFGANFIVQFLILSLVFGIPLFTLQLCLGQQLSAGVVDMWRISPLFQGVGIALLIAQALIGLYSIVGVSWMFIYFRDSFITKQDQYRWAEPFEPYRTESRTGFNDTYKISETVPDYFNGIVLQRHNLIDGHFSGGIKFQVAFNLAVVWMIVFVSLSKGLRSYAKVVYVFSLLPIFGTFVLCAKLLGMSPNDTFHEIFPATAWGEFFLNTKVLPSAKQHYYTESWIAASQEAFLTWGLLGAAIMQLSSHNKHKHLLQRDSSLVIILTITILMLIAFLANTCIEIIHANGYTYIPNSFERINTYAFLRSNRDPLPPSLTSTPVRYMTHSSFIIGDRVVRPGMDKTMESGYQVLRFATELVPATLALLGPTHISPFWAVLFYFILILFGIAQQLAIWHCVITGIMAMKAKVLKQWETTITFFTCTFGFILGLPMATEFGIFVVYFLDYCVGGSWWLLFIYLIQIVAVFMIRGRPYSGDTVVTALFTPNNGSCMQAWLAPLLSFVWNVILPVALMVVCITQFKSGNFKELFIWHHAPSVEYWPTWARQVGSLIQLLPILCIPVVAIIQSYRYLNNGPPDILDRIQLLYRPPLDSEHLSDLSIQQAASAATTPATNPPAEDPPPKYTPPPSYTTATGARIAKMLRQSIRRSVRRIQSVLGEGSRATERPPIQVPPPDYSAVLVEMNQSPPSVTIDVTDSSPPNQSDRISRELSSLQSSPLTAADVASILRSSFRRSTIRTHRIRNEEVPSGSLSAECLVDTVAPIGEDSLVLETIRSEKDNRSSVI